ncbi:zf-HC2 domain-containing protein [Actinomadura sp. ATCC 31491]|uniref:Zf-HC2 domain-containing protein n=1 Tax=Actinomadura luzonensis TaxID=2805427 RepID=A0ABT0FRJ0_9ACTN|nr:zf-HC2 domain-containing protein [Actinomadura luzonensis]MCK2214925.1 zf-HC2 domain-containing protein [Actinomadura luzonensis]
MNEVQHEDVAAYALGLLDEGERAAFERHLAGCPSCAAEVGMFAEMGELIKGVHPDDLLPSPPDPQVESLLVRRAAAERRRRGLHRTMTAAAACVLIATGVFLAVRSFTGGPNPDSVHSPAAALLMTGRTYTVTDPATGVNAVVGLEDKGWGTHVALQLKGVRGPLQCRLLAVGDDGRSETVASWGVPDKGYGVPGAPDPLLLHGGTSLTQDHLNHFTVETFDGRTLATIAT